MSSISGFTSFKFDKDPAKWVVNEELRNFISRRGFSQNADSDFKSSRRVYIDQTRFFSSNLCEKKLKNGEVTRRLWVIYSEAHGSIYCGPCRLFSDAPSSFAKGRGFNDWKNARVYMEKHETSMSHRESAIALKTRASGQDVHSELDESLTQEKRYWMEVLQRVVVIVRKLSERGLALRGSDELLGSNHNGNFLMSVEILAEFDPLVEEHVRRYGRPGSGGTNYLSSTTYEQVVLIMARNRREVLSANIRAAKYILLVDRRFKPRHFACRPIIRCSAICPKGR